MRTTTIGAMLVIASVFTAQTPSAVAQTIYYGGSAHSYGTDTETGKTVVLNVVLSGYYKTEADLIEAFRGSIHSHPRSRFTDRENYTHYLIDTWVENDTRRYGGVARVTVDWNFEGVRKIHEVTYGCQLESVPKAKEALLNLLEVRAPNSSYSNYFVSPVTYTITSCSR